MVGAMGSAASGLALAGPQMLKWIKGYEVQSHHRSEGVQHSPCASTRLGSSGTAIGLVGIAIYKWRDKIGDFLRGAWDGSISKAD